MKSPSRMVAAPSNGKGRLVSIFVGAVLLPSVALSVVSFNSVPKHAESLKIGLQKQAEKVLLYIEKDLETAARAKALQAARVAGTELLLEGRDQPIRVALERGGVPGDAFDSLRLEASSPIAGLSEVFETRGRDVEILREALTLGDAPMGADAEDSLPIAGPDGSKIGVLRFRYTCAYAHGTILRDFFEHDFSNPDQSWVIRVTEPNGEILYETAPTPDNKFEVKRIMQSSTFQGLRLYLRYKDRSIEQDVRRWALGKMALVGFIDLMLGAGLFLVFSNVRREMHLSRLKSDFVANVSHELKTPLALIRLFAETLELGRVQGEGKARQYYQIINKESQRLTQLINNILDFSRIEAGRKEYEFAPTAVNRVVNEVLDAYRFQIEQQGFSLEADLAEDLPEAPVDKEALGQALINLVNNAIKYSKDEKHIRVTTRRNGDSLVLSVTDRGIGIPKGEQKKIFEKFYRAENSLVHETKGSGLGLALVRHIMLAHGGSVEVESVPGQGSTFTLQLPLQARTA